MRKLILALLLLITSTGCIATPRLGARYPRFWMEDHAHNGKILGSTELFTAGIGAAVAVGTFIAASEMPSDSNVLWATLLPGVAELVFAVVSFVLGIDNLDRARKWEELLNRKAKPKKLSMFDSEDPVYLHTDSINGFKSSITWYSSKSLPSIQNNFPKFSQFNVHLAQEIE